MMVQELSEDEMAVVRRFGMDRPDESRADEHRGKRVLENLLLLDAPDLLALMAEQERDAWTVTVEESNDHLAQLVRERDDLAAVIAEALAETHELIRQGYPVGVLLRILGLGPSGAADRLRAATLEETAGLFFEGSTNLVEETMLMDDRYVTTHDWLRARAVEFRKKADQ